ncbi:hypothetical protein ABZW18_05635 [Streptomyces sp. NPDC004647]|uniref:hypothetical protein n=1 Tax=Streptomyces sp. NPDC004647 TaxID=3154671 RepID=UPI0033AD176F
MEQSSAQLARELSRLPDTKAQRPTGPPPPDGARAGEGLAEVFRLSVECAPVVAVMLQTVQLFRDWSSLRPGRTARLKRRNGEEIEVAGLSVEDQRRLIDSWLGDQDSPS